MGGKVDGVILLCKRLFSRYLGVLKMSVHAMVTLVGNPLGKHAQVKLDHESG